LTHKSKVIVVIVVIINEITIFVHGGMFLILLLMKMNFEIL